MLITSASAPSSIDYAGDTFLPDAFGRFNLPPDLTAELLTSGAWHEWTTADAPAFGPWVNLLPTLAEAVDGDLLPCFVSEFAPEFGFPEGLAYRTVGAQQAQLMGTVAYMTGPTFPDDLAVPDPDAVICLLPDELRYSRQPLGLAANIDITTGQQTLCSIGVLQDVGGFGVFAVGWATGIGACPLLAWNLATS